MNKFLKRLASRPWGSRILNGSVAAVLITSTNLITPRLLWAAHGADHQASIRDLVPYYVNFGLFVAILLVLLWKPARRFWFQRIKQMEQQLQEARQTRDVAQEALTTSRDRLNSLSELVTRTFENAKQEAKTEGAEIVSTSQQKARAIVDQAHFLAAAEESRLEQTLQRETVTAVLEKARGEIQQKLTPEQDRAHRWAALQRITDLLQ